MLLLTAAVGGFSFAAIEMAIKNPACGRASEYSVSRSIATKTLPAFLLRVLYISQP